ncbi:GNAT family N-acetyltransferase [Solitalea koreensis]|uniref:Ribosomal-protein-alanine N-acetyltransferase n=1 Tax=Solitalea koreensis TaxID=543615 RepID=A0A521BZX4_9SPHI|nr:GNAT family N-acetyltransferase [Solitalea koreensis]SMO52694.1 ribosomal-protein-alanine N-acetyltransferase [Solitalea koreensis]
MINKIEFNPFPGLSTERLALRQLSLADEKEILKLRSDERVNEFLDRAKAETIEDARSFINKIITGTNECFYWAITFKNTPQLIGTICFWNLSEDRFQAEVGYELLPEFQGKGIMTEVLLAVIQFGFETMKLKTIVADLRADNLNSRRLLEKTGFKIDANMVNTEDNMIVYSLANPMNK